MMLLGTASMLGLGTLLIGELAQKPEKAMELLSASLLTTGLTAGVVGVLFATLAPRISPGFQPLASSPRAVAIFALGVCLTGATLVLDQAVVGMLRADVQLWRNAVFAVAKLVALVVIPVSQNSGLEIYAVWLLGNVLSFVPLIWLLVRGGVTLQACRPELGLLRRLGRSAMAHHALNLALQGPSLALPVLVTIVLSARMNASFYIAWMIAGFAFVPSTALSTVFYAVASANPAAMAGKLRTSAGLALLAGTGLWGLLALSAPFLLRLFGQTYAAQAARDVAFLGLAAWPMVVKYHYVALCRIRARIAEATLVVAATGIVELLFAAVAGHFFGLNALCIGWLVANFIEVLFMWPPVYRTVIDPTLAAVSLGTSSS